MTQPAAQPAPQQDGGSEAALTQPLEYDAYPVQLEVAARETSAALVPYVPPEEDTPDEVEVPLVPGWRSILLTTVMVALTIGFGWLVATSRLRSSPDLWTVVLALGWVLMLWAQVAPFVRPTRVRVDGEGLLVKPRVMGIRRTQIEISWASIDRIAIVSRMVGSGKSRHRKTTLEWYPKPGITYPGLTQSSGRSYELDLGDIDDDRLAAVIARYGPPDLIVDDSTLLG